MSRLLRHDPAVESIKSVTLADLQFGAPSRFDGVIAFGKMAAMLAGFLTLGAGAGTAAYVFASAGGPVRATEPAAVAASEFADETVPDAETANFAVAESEPEMDVALAEIPPSLSEYLAPNPQEAQRFVVTPAVQEARLPRPRPALEPASTGSITRTPQRHAEPCSAIRLFGRILPLRVRCSAPYAQRGPRYYEPYVIR